MKTYAGIGSRETPPKLLALMKIIGIILASKGYILNTGAAKGADQAFANGASIVKGKINIFLPWPTYESEWISTLQQNVNVTVLDKNKHTAAINSVKLHPAFNRLSRPVINLHARNYLIIENVDFVICYTPNGETVGGTGQGIRIANSLGKPVLNLGNKKDTEVLLKIMGGMV